MEEEEEEKSHQQKSLKVREKDVNTKQKTVVRNNEIRFRTKKMTQLLHVEGKEKNTNI